MNITNEAREAALKEVRPYNLYDTGHHVQEAINAAVGELAPYLEHLGHCELQQGPEHPYCNCGLKQLLSRYNRKEPTK